MVPQPQKMVAYLRECPFWAKSHRHGNGVVSNLTWPVINPTQKMPKLQPASTTNSVKKLCRRCNLPSVCWSPCCSEGRSFDQTDLRIEATKF